MEDLKQIAKVYKANIFSLAEQSFVYECMKSAGVDPYGKHVVDIGCGPSVFPAMFYWHHDRPEIYRGYERKDNSLRPIDHLAYFVNPGNCTRIIPLSFNGPSVNDCDRPDIAFSYFGLNAEFYNPIQALRYAANFIRRGGILAVTAAGVRMRRQRPNAVPGKTLQHFHPSTFELGLNYDLSTKFEPPTVFPVGHFTEHLRPFATRLGLGFMKAAFRFDSWLGRRLGATPLFYVVVAKKAELGVNMNLASTKIADLLNINKAEAWALLSECPHYNATAISHWLLGKPKFLHLDKALYSDQIRQILHTDQ